MGDIKPKQHQKQHHQRNRQAQLELKVTAWRTNARHHGSCEQQPAQEAAYVRRIVDFHTGKAAAEVDGKTDHEIDRSEVDHRFAQFLAIRSLVEGDQHKRAYGLSNTRTDRPKTSWDYHRAGSFKSYKTIYLYL